MFLYVVEQKQVLSLINLNVLIYENMKQIIVALCHKHTRENNLNQINKHSDFVPLGFRSFIRWCVIKVNRCDDDDDDDVEQRQTWTAAAL